MSHVIIFVCLTLNMGGENLWKCYTPSVSFWSSYFRLAARPRSSNSIAPFFVSASNELSTPALRYPAHSLMPPSLRWPAHGPTTPSLRWQQHLRVRQHLRRWYRRYLHLRVRHHLHGASKWGERVSHDRKRDESGAASATQAVVASVSGEVDCVRGPACGSNERRGADGNEMSGRAVWSIARDFRRPLIRRSIWNFLFSKIRKSKENGGSRTLVHELKRVNYIGGTQTC